MTSDKKVIEITNKSTFTATIHPPSYMSSRNLTPVKRRYFFPTPSTRRQAQKVYFWLVVEVFRRTNLIWFFGSHVKPQQ